MTFVFQRSIPAIALFLVAIPGSAHHSRAYYDQEREVAVEGEVTRFLWANPHSYIDVRTLGEGAESVTWTIEAPGPPGLIRRGWTSRTLQPGDHVTVIGNPSGNQDSNSALLVSVMTDDGTVLSLSANRAGPSSPQTEFVAAELSGTWLITGDPNVFLPFTQPATSWSLTDKGIAAVESFDVDADMLDCVPQTAPYSMVFGTLMDIELGEDEVAIRIEDHDDHRTVYMNLDSHDGAEFSGQGHSIGRWDDDVLVVDTTHFADQLIGNANRLPSGSQRHYVERFALTPDGTQLEYMFRIEDPEYLAQSVTGTMLATYRPDLQFVSEPCNLEAARRYRDEE